MAISDEDLAQELRTTWGITSPSEPIPPVWIRIAAKARKLLTPNMQMPEPKPFTEPLQPGDIVSVRATVVAYCLPDLSNQKWVNIRFDGAQRPQDLRTIDPSYLTLIERSEPDWAPGDVAQDERGATYSRTGTEQFRRIMDGVQFSRDEIPGKLTPCDVVPRKPEK